MFRKHAFAILATGIWCSGLAIAGDRPQVTDPTQPPNRSHAPAAKTPTTEPLVLHSTHVAASNRSAVINRMVVTVGSRIDGAVVTAIEPAQVTIRRGSVLVFLRLQSLPVKRPAKDAG